MSLGMQRCSSCGGFSPPGGGLCGPCAQDERAALRKIAQADEAELRELRTEPVLSRLLELVDMSDEEFAARYAPEPD